LVNGIQPDESFYLNPGDLIDNNNTLAIIRSYSMKQHFNEAASKLDAHQIIDQSRFIAATHDNVGKDSRYAEIVVKIKQRPQRPERQYRGIHL